MKKQTQKGLVNKKRVAYFTIAERKIMGSDLDSVRKL
jgi:hypothetical protein